MGRFQAKTGELESLTKGTSAWVLIKLGTFENPFNNIDAINIRDKCL